MNFSQYFIKVQLEKSIYHDLASQILQNLIYVAFKQVLYPSPAMAPFQPQGIADVQYFPKLL